MTDDKDALLRECKELLSDVCHADVHPVPRICHMIDRITAALDGGKDNQKAERPEPVAWVLPGDDTARADGWIDARIDKWSEFTKPLYGPELLAYADRMAAERDAARVTCREIRAQQKEDYDRAEAAESALARVEKLLREPSDAMREKLFDYYTQNKSRNFEYWQDDLLKFIQAELLLQVEEGK